MGSGRLFAGACWTKPAVIWQPPGMSKKAIEAVVTGRVQGVSYRAWTQRTARAEGLRGWVRNEADGSVRTLIAGEGEAVARMQRELWRGPSAARVDGVSVSEAAVPQNEDFHILR